ncbi:hypothetical protein [Sphaerisporangium flaviroseum]|uniref:hypothetical protein n=1 Tax=Sphaerisporangium flaviroseum TaxID=509199 RepID=UPI0031E9C1C7
MTTPLKGQPPFAAVGDTWLDAIDSFEPAAEMPCSPRPLSHPIDGQMIEERFAGRLGFPVRRRLVLVRFVGRRWQVVHWD